MASSIVQTFEKVAFDHPERTAVYAVSEDQTRTFRQLHDDMRMISRRIAAMPLPAGPCIVCSVGNRVGFIPLILAGLEANAALVLLDGDGPLSHVLAIAGRLGAHAVVVSADMASSSAPTTQPLPGGLHMLLVHPCVDAVWRYDLAQGPIILKMTSGSSDSPRAVIATEANLLSDGRHIIEAMDIRRDDVSLGVIPLAHSYGLGNLVMPLLIQGSAIVLREGFAPRQLEKDVRACEVTIVPAVPYFFEHLRRSEHSEALASVRLLVTAGAPILFETTAFFKQVIGRKIHSFYGSSETGGISFDDSEEVSRPLTVGRPMPGTKVDLKPCWNSQKAEGRVFVRGAAVASGYAGAPPADEADPRFVDGGFLTADVGIFNSLGRLVLIGRMSRLINVAGRKVDPVEVEAVLRSLPGVVEVSVIGVPCTTRGEQVAACISRQDEQLSVADVRAYCASRLAAYKVPRQIVFVEVLPVDARGKIDRRAIGALVSHHDDFRPPRV